MTYATISRASQRVSQLAFLNLLRKDRAYQLEAPTLWDVDFRTAVAQAELEDREQPGAYHKLRFARADGGDPIEIETTRPGAAAGLRRAGRASRRRALQAAVRHRGARRRSSTCPVPILAHPLASPDKGTGVAMICTFGDLTDVIWWRELNLPVRAILQAERHAAADRVGQPRLGIARRGVGAGRLRSAGLDRRSPRRARRSSSCCARRAICSASRGRSRTR